MTIVGLDIATIADLGTQVMTTGALRGLISSGDEVFEMLISIAVLVYEQSPG